MIQLLGYHNILYIIIVCYIVSFSCQCNPLLGMWPQYSTLVPK